MKRRRLTPISLRKRLATVPARKIPAFLLATACLLGARDFGPPAGSRFPGFELPDQNGQRHSLKSVLGPKGAVILFYPSADWCSYCKAELVEMQANQDAFRKLGLGIAAVSYDSVAILKDFAGRKGIQFPLLSDSNSKVIRALRIVNDSAPRDISSDGAARPGSFVLDARGVIVSSYFEDDASRLSTSASILVHQFGWTPPEPPAEVKGKQLTAMVGASNALVAPGQRVTLMLDIDLQPTMHVYAPGVDGYIPIDWKMQDSQAAAAYPAIFPRSERLNLKAIGEIVPAYSGHFRLTRDITIPEEAKLRPMLDGSGHFTVPGSLRYQACDERLCYIPQELHLNWTFQSEAFDLQRVPPELQRRAP